jgi:4-diphosphocytidyl-2C-methyl-D-erythritol kinase
MTRDVRVLARAKLTLSLQVLGVRPDGYHELEALVVSLRDPHDVVGLRLQAPFGVRVRLSGRAVIGVPADESNLAVRAARVLLEAAADGDDPGPWAASGLDISLHKTIPAGAGLGGGSADAAAVIVGGARLLGLSLDSATLAALGASLGSDVPFCVLGGAAWMRGRGEIIDPLPPFPLLSRAPQPGSAPPSVPSPPPGVPSPGWPGVPPRTGPGGVPVPTGASRLPAVSPPPGPSAGSSWPVEPEIGGLALVVAVPPFPLSTPAVYRAWDQLGGPRSTRAVPLPDGLAGPGFSGLGLPDHLVNDLEPAAEHVEPRLRPFRETLEALSGGPALLAGSGSAYVVAAASPAQAAVLATQVGVELRATAFATGLAARGVEAQKGPD